MDKTHEVLSSFVISVQGYHISYSSKNSILVLFKHATILILMSPDLNSPTLSVAIPQVYLNAGAYHTTVPQSRCYVLHCASHGWQVSSSTHQSIYSGHHQLHQVTNSHRFSRKEKILINIRWKNGAGETGRWVSILGELTKALNLVFKMNADWVTSQ